MEKKNWSRSSFWTVEMEIDQEGARERALWRDGNVLWPEVDLHRCLYLSKLSNRTPHVNFFSLVNLTLKGKKKNTEF